MLPRVVDKGMGVNLHTLTRDTAGSNLLIRGVGAITLGDINLEPMTEIISIHSRIPSCQSMMERFLGGPMRLS